MIRVGLGQAEGLDTVRTVEQVIAQCKQGLRGYGPQAGFVFCCSEFDARQMLDAVHHHFPKIDLIGCTTVGEFSSRCGVSEDSIALMLLQSDRLEIKAGVGRKLSRDPREAVRSAVRAAKQELSNSPAFCLVLPDLYEKPAGVVVTALNEALGADCPAFGGCASRQDVAKSRILQFFNDEILEDSIPIMLFAGPVRHHFVIANSWKPAGRPTKVVAARGRKVLRIGDFSALDFYRHYLGMHTAPATAFPLAVYETGEKAFYLREPVHYDSNDGSITFSEAIPEGCTVQITESARDYLLQDTRNSMNSLTQIDSGFKPEFALAFSCFTRKEALGTRVGEELKILKDALPSGTPIVGFYGSGEIGPLAAGRKNFFHNATLLTLIIGESRNETAKVESEEAGEDFAFDAKVDEQPPETCTSDELKIKNEFLKKQLARSERYRRRLEDVKELSSALYRKIVQEVDEAHQEIWKKEQALRSTEEKYRRIVETAAEGFVLLDENLRVRDVNKTYCQLLDYSRDELLGKAMLDLASSGFREFLVANRERLLAEEHTKFEGILQKKNDRRVPVIIHGNTLRDAHGAFLGHVAFVTDLTEQMLLQKELLESEMRYRGMYENAVQGMFQVTLSGKVIRVNPAYARMLGYDSPHELQSETSTSPFYENPEDRARMLEALKHKGKLTNFELKLQRKDGSPVWILVNVRLIETEDEPFMEGIAVDNTARKLAEDEVRRSREMFRHLAIHDSLTGLYNTRHLYRALEDLIIESEAGGLSFSLIFMDMDNFKRVVDAYGHLNGSQALKEVAQTIEDSLTEPAFGVAYGGDEFVVVLPGLDKLKALEKAEEIRFRMKETVYLSGQGHSVRLSASFGIATFPDDAVDLSGLLALADQAMFHVKEKGKDAVGVGKEL